MITISVSEFAIGTNDNNIYLVSLMLVWLSLLGLLLFLLYMERERLRIGVRTPPKDYTKPRRTIQSPDRLYKAPERLWKPLKT